MLFIDEDAQDQFHKSPTLLQVVCSMLESALVSHFYQCEVIEAQWTEGTALAMLVICPTQDVDAPVDEELIDTVLSELNQKFRRKDSAPTIRVETEDYNLIHVRVTTTQDFAQLT